MVKHAIRERTGPRGTVWSAVVDLGYDRTTGKRKQRRVSSRISKKDLEREIARLIVAEAEGRPVSGGAITLNAFLDQWLASIKTKVRPATHERYTRALKDDVRARLGKKRLDKLQPLDIQRLMTDLTDRGLAPASVNLVRTVLRRALKQAVRWRLIAWNPVDEIDPVKEEAPEMKFWSPAEATRVLIAARGDPLEALWRLALTTGMRRGELIGLSWTNVDLDRATLAVKQTIVRGANGEMILGKPKSKRGERTITLSADDVALLRAHRARPRAEGVPSGRFHELDLVFTGDDGGAISPSELARRYEALIAKAGVDRIRFHDLRHTAAALMVEANEHPRVMMERMGHATLEMTLKHYAHVVDERHQQAAEHVAELLKPEP